MDWVWIQNFLNIFVTIFKTAGEPILQFWKNIYFMFALENILCHQILGEFFELWLKFILINIFNDDDHYVDDHYDDDNNDDVIFMWLKIISKNSIIKMSIFL